MNKLKLIIIILIFCLTLGFFNVATAGDGVATIIVGKDENGNEIKVTIEQAGWYEKYWSGKVFIPIGDSLYSIIEDVGGKNISITNLVYNHVEAVNPNFFDDYNAGLAHVSIKKAVERWFVTFRKLAITVYLICLLTIGFRAIYNSTPQGIQKVKALFIEWLKGILYMFFMPYAIWMMFRINEALVKYVEDIANGVDYVVGGGNFSDGMTWSADMIEYRSPEYVSMYTGFKTNSRGGEYRLKKIEENTANNDLIKAIRALAGATYQLHYVIIWYILIGQLLAFMYIYYKRYFKISFFIAAFPVICIFQAIGIMKDGKARAVQGWLGELISNIFLQFIHAVVYTVITSLVFEIILKQLVANASTVNWLIIIIAINFVPEGEKILSKCLKALSQGSSAEGAASGGLKKDFKQLSGGVKQIHGQLKGGGGAKPPTPPPE